MSVFLEFKKAKRTGLLAAYIAGGMLAAAVPVVNMAVRSEMYLTRQGNPVSILFHANWQMMAMLNILLVTSGTCLLYHIEYADNAIQKVKSLPLWDSSVFFGKALLTILMSAAALAIEAGAIAFCSCYWMEIGKDFWMELCKSFGYAFGLLLPCMILSLLIAQICRNMWVSLGIGVVCTFTATMLPTDRFMPSLFPFAMPFQIFADADRSQIIAFITAAAAELAILVLAELLLLRIRRWFE